MYEHIYRKLAVKYRKEHIYWAKKTAFTLAEVLITLGIIGVVAAMTIPNLITEHQKRTTVTKLQRAISVINQAYRLAYDDVGEASAEEAFNMGSEEYFNTYWAPYIKILTYCSSYKVCGYDSNTPFKLLNGKYSTYHFDYTNGRIAFYTMDGFVYIVNTYSGYGISPQVVVDINGSAGPNRVGRDIFTLIRVEDDGGGVQPYGYDFADGDSVNENCSSGSDINPILSTCAERIRRAGWKIEKDYPW